MLQGKIALVTGAGSGIGRGIARCYARNGATVVIAEYDEESGIEAAQEVTELGGARPRHPHRHHATGHSGQRGRANHSSIWPTGHPD